MKNKIHALLALCRDTSFNEKGAEELVRCNALNSPFSDPEYPTSKTSFLAEAVFHDNFRMAELLLRYGADPNLIVNEENVFWDLQYIDGEDDETNEKRLEIAQKMLEYGADPHINTDNTEDLFSYVRFKIFEDYGLPSWLYLSRFFILLIAYGGRSSHDTPVIYSEFDKTDMKQYQFSCCKTNNNLLFGRIEDKNGNLIAEV